MVSSAKVSSQCYHKTICISMPVEKFCVHVPESCCSCSFFMFFIAFFLFFVFFHRFKWSKFQMLSWKRRCSCSRVPADQVFCAYVHQMLSGKREQINPHSKQDIDQHDFRGIYLSQNSL